MFPDFDDLPKIEGMPQGCAWGVFDREGQKDLLGTLNFLTPDVVKAAAEEVEDGISISLNWPINALAKLPFFRRPPKHTVINLHEQDGVQSKGWDDELEFNTQCASQWDSLCHHQHQSTGLAYNGAKPDREAFSVESTAENRMPTLDHWHSRGCLVARAVLVDYKAYAEATNIDFRPFGPFRITVDDIEACAAHQGVQFRHGDVLIIKTGATEALEEMVKTPENLAQMSEGLAGVDGSEASARWLWNHRFAAVASDSNAFEAYPPLKPDGTPGQAKDLVLHPILLSLFGMPIGELWDLSKLSEYCREKKRYSFMLTSSPLNYPGLIGSPPNAIAIF